MKAVIYDRYGPPEVLHVAEVEKPMPADDEVLIRVMAAEATKGDCEMRKCEFAVSWLSLPMRLVLGIRKPKRRVLGGYFSGVIESVGKEVEEFKPGDELFGSARLRLGGYGEYVALPESYTIVPKPSNISFEEASSVPLGGLNALHFLRLGNIRPGEKVLINGAGGSIGIFGVQIAKSMGAKVTAVDKTEKLELLRSIGADHVIDYTQEDFTRNGNKYDVIMSTVAGASYPDMIASLNPGGRYLIANPKFMDMLRAPLTSMFSDKKAIFAFAQEKPEELLALKEMIETGKIKAVVDQILPMDQAPEAHRLVESEQRLGAIVIKIGNT